MLYPALERPVVTLADDDVRVPPIVVNERLPERCEISPPVSSHPLLLSVESGPPVALDDAKGRRSIGIISAVGSKFAVQKIGVTVFGNEYNVVPVATWGIDDLIASTLTLLLGGKSRREAVTYAKGASLITRRQAGCLVAGESEG